MAANVLALFNRLGVDSVLSWSQDHLPPGLLFTLEAAGIRITHEAQPSIRAGLTGVNAAVAETGSLILMEGAGTPLSASLLPEIHVAICSESDIYPSLSEALCAPRLKRATAAVLISGPSRTADIEMSLTIGVHGPGELYVYCLTS